ncbi:RNA polymerase sigma-70 factor (ECF subfamily) [Phytomonospora endophytica]|uniref:RNA polymerase sigma-70 factor (ECF subfamily) n=2 Tax=Phytomonospora endophytica TaxID=714109 RepID=A0A841FNE1_9ACTN|nr:RNA polymerase sigma-70 factor (ECF subfamily) [Phytomonospora endophytica]GIG68373.1 DNA-directed RNA polymerase sigma-70 factor [Phytomonospora endophytica]
MAMDAHAAEDLEALRVPLTGYCYRLLGSAADTDDAVQETLIRASSKWDLFDPSRGRVSTWVHRIATNVCLDMLRSARRRELVVDVEAAAGRGPGLGAPLPARAWVEPMPDARLVASRDPGDVVLERESVRLAFIAALQHLAPRQRAVLILRDVLAFTARETAEVLDTTTASVNSALQRARAVLDEHRPDPFDVDDPADPAQRDLLRRYVRAFETHDVAELTAVLRADAVSTMPPFLWRLDGGPAIASLLGVGGECAGARLVPCDVNGARGFGQYRPDDDGLLHPFALVTVEIRGGLIARTVAFLGTAGRFGEFGLPAVLRREDLLLRDR